MSIIKEFKRDSTKDYLYILRSLNEIPFPLGKNLLGDFLLGLKNESIEKNKMYLCENFSKLNFLDKREVLNLILTCISNGWVEEKSSFFNNSIKTLSITKKGQEELLEPQIKENSLEEELKIEEKEIKIFKELNNFLGNLNLEQRKAVVSPKEKILCVAGAGSGKTAVLVKRIEFLNKMKKIRGKEILAITFTRKSKEEMEKRLKLNGVECNIETFNSFCEKILLKNTFKIYGKKMRTINQSEKVLIILRGLEIQGINLEDALKIYFEENQIKNKNKYELQSIFINNLFQIRDYFKITGNSLDKFYEEGIKKDNFNIKLVYNLVSFINKEIAIQGFRTYSDQILDTIKFFKEKEKNIPKFEHILVDEFQDINEIQVELLDLLNPKNLFCVGDPRQAIFGWRGSNIKFILEFKKKYSAEIINLNKNYRSSKKIINLMNDSVNFFGFSDLEGVKEEEGFLELKKFNNEEEEEEYIIGEILKSNTEREEIFILFRTNKELKNFSEILKKRKIAHILKNEFNEEIIPKKNELTLSTIHSIKGLEAKEVFLKGVNSKNFPCRSGDYPILDFLEELNYNKFEEERRLFYVAISRAKDILHLTYSGKNISPFVNEKLFR